MPMIVPHQSQVGIATGNAGQAAPYRSASAFVTPGQAAMPNGLNQLARGMDKLGDALAKYGLDRLKMQNATDLLADKLAYEDALRDFDSNYRQTHQGASARDAEEAYTQFHQEQYQRLQEKWGGNPYLMQGVDQMAASIRQPSMQHAVTYRDQQEDMYRKDLLSSSEARTLELFADPTRSAEEKGAALQEHENTLRMFAGQKPVMVDGKVQWQGGRNIDAQLMALRQKAAVSNVEGLLAGKDVDGAQRALDMARGGAGGVLSGRTYTGGGTVRGLPAEIDAKIEAEAKRQGFDPVLAKAIAMQESGGRQGEVSHAGAVGVMQIIPKYAGDFGGGDVRGNVDDNIRVGIKEISTYLKRYGGDLRKALLAYNWGPGNVDAWLKTGKGVKGQPMPKEAREYADRVLGRISGGSFAEASKGQDGKRPEMYVAYDNPEGMTEKGNIDIANRPQVKTEDGGTATMRSMSVNFDGAEVLLPTVSQDGRLLSEDEAISEYKKTGNHLGKFDTPEHASTYAQKLHEQQERMYLRGEASGASRGVSLTPAQDMALQGKIDHLKREQAQEAGLTAQAFGNHLEYGLDKGDFTAAERDVEALRSLGFTKEAAELADRLELSRTAYTALNDAGDLPLVEQGAAAKKRLDDLVTPDNAKASTAMRDSVDKALAQKQAAFVKDPAAYVAQLPAMQGEMSAQERVQRSLELQSRMGKGLPYEPRVLAAEQAKKLKSDYDKLETPATRVAWLSQVKGEFGPYAQQALTEMKVPAQVTALLPVLGRMNDRSMGLALTALEVKDSDIPGLGKDAKQDAVDAVAGNKLMQDILSISRAFPANDAMRALGTGWETMLTNYVKLRGKLEDFDTVFESTTEKDCFLLLPRNSDYDASDVASATQDVREDLRVKLLADIPADTQQGRIDRANLTGLISRGKFISDETGTKVTLVDPQHGRPVMYADGTPMTFDIATIVKERAERNKRVQLAEETEE